MRIVKMLSIFSAIVVFMTGCAAAPRKSTGSQKALETSGIQPELTNLAAKLGKGIIDSGIKKIAILDFVDIQGRTTELGRYLAEQLSVEMVNEDGISVVDRSNINSILAEHKLTMSGLVNPENAKELGKFAGIDAIVTGTVTTLAGNIMLTVKVIATETAQIVAAAKTTIKNTSELQQLSTQLEPSVPGISTGTTSTVKVSYPDANTIAAKDIGNLRIVLKSIRPVTEGSGSQAVQFVFDFINTNLKENVLVATVSAKNWSGNIIHSQLIDSIGQPWGVSQISGLSYARGVGEQNGAQIVRSIMNGKNVPEGQMYVGNTANLWVGELTEIPATQSNRVTMLFARSGNTNNNGNIKIADPFQFECELIIGNSSPEQPRKCSFTTLMFDNVSLSK